MGRTCADGGVHKGVANNYSTSLEVICQEEGERYLKTRRMYFLLDQHPSPYVYAVVFVMLSNFSHPLEMPQSVVA